MFHRTRTFRFVAAFLVLTLLIEAFAPIAAFALTSGSSQTEFMGGGGGGLVNPFTGAFSYSIPVLTVPGPNGVGYGLTLSYNNNTSGESEASWVGAGWSLNAGAVNRVKRGFPDDYKKSKVTYWKNSRVNSTIRVKARAAVEVTSFDLIPDKVKNLIKNSTGIDPKNPQGSVGMSEALTLQFNNQTGFDWAYDLGVGGLGISANLGLSENGVELDGDFSPLQLFMSLGPNYIGTPEMWDQAYDQYGRYQRLLGLWDRMNEFHPPARVPRYSGYALTFSGAAEGDILPNVGLEGGITGSYARVSSILKDEEDAYGYLYSDAVANSAEAMDYYTEKEDSYRETDQRLPIPFSNADYFSVAGVSGGGVFRAYQRGQGHFRPPSKVSGTFIGHGNLELHVGEEIGFGGAGAGVGTQKMITRGWTSNGLSFNQNINDGEQKFFRFRGDRGGSILDVTDDPVQLTPSSVIPNKWLKNDPNADVFGPYGDIWPVINNGERVGRTTYVGFNTNSDVLDGPAFNCYYSEGNVHYRSFSRRSKVIDDYVNRNDAVIKDGLGEFSVVGGDGMTYVYGLPIYSRDEVSMSYGLYGLNKVQDLENNFIAYKHVSEGNYEDNDNLNGMESLDPYANAFLLTEVVSPDYVDRTNNGPTPDDLGGYVIFNYKTTAGTYDKDDPETDNWYKWRSPYRGTYYNRNSLSDPYDDLGSFSSGYKEIYYLESIETKTHKAVFYTSSRDDAYEAHHNESVAGANPDATTADAGANEKVHKLDKIELWSKEADGSLSKLISTTNFRYDYFLCQGLPNAKYEGGKLTLKRLWFEYEGVVSARISPYEFGYEYRKTANYPPQIRNNSLYQNIINHGDNLTAGSASDQNPDYSEFDVDRWGNYQKNGAARYSKYQQWVDQKLIANEDFDPAPWQLKWIKLPSGGEIHIQYEQNDYRYVQHRDAMVMVPLKSFYVDTDPEPDNEPYTYELDLDAIGVDASEIGELENLLRKHFGDKDGNFVGSREYIYYRLLYGLVIGSDPDLDKCTSEYFTGYAAVTDVINENNKLYVKIGDPDDGKTRPERKCQEFYRSARQGILVENCGSPQNSINDGADDEKSVVAAIYNLFDTIFNVILEVTAPSFALCEDINVTESYLRIPTIKDKKGGGIRVKRVLTYDPGLEDEDIALDGTEYFYQTPDGRSSGVATNEPVNGREENALVYLNTQANSNFDADSIITGKSMRQLELPVGESLMPAASIGYSRVIARNIHTGKSGTGFTVYNYYTARDYPFDLQHFQSSNLPDPEQGLSQEAKDLMTEPMTSLRSPRSAAFPIELTIYGNYQHSINATQGFRFVVNGMHGQARSVGQYIGAFHPDSENDLDDAALASHIEYEYFQPWESIPMMSEVSSQNIYQAYPGKVVEVVTESRELIDDRSDYSGQVDGGVFFAFPFPLPIGSFSGRIEVDKQKLRTHVTSKVIEYPVILKSIKATKDNIVDKTEYVAFDPASGAPVLIKKSDGFDGLTINGAPEVHDGSYYTVAIPAWQYYANFGQMAKTQRLTIKSDIPENSNDGNSGVAFDKRFIRKTSVDEHYLNVRSVKPKGSVNFLNSLVSGDMLELQAPQIEANGTYKTDNKGNVVKRPLGLYHVGRIGASRVELLPVSYSVTNNEQEVRDIWVEIVKSGRNNRVGASVGGFSTYGMPPVSIEKPIQ